MAFDPEQQTPNNLNASSTATPLEQSRGSEVSALTPEADNAPEKKKSRKALYGSIGVVAGAAIAAGAIIGIHAGEAPKKSDHDTSASADPTQTPEATPSPTPEALTVQSAEIPAGLSPEQLGTTFVSRLSDWDMAGATPANRDAWLNTNGNAAGDAFATQLAAKNGSIYAEALFGTDWESEPSLATFVPNQEKNNADIIALWFKTSAGASALDKVPFRDWITVDSVSVISQSNGTLSERITVTDNNNAGQSNRAETLAPGTAAQNGEKFDVLATFTTTNGVEKISNFDIVKHP